MSDTIIKSGVQINGKTYDLVETNHYNCDGCDLHVYGKDTVECAKRHNCVVTTGRKVQFCHFHEVQPCP